jgi:hypothetical protein
VIKVVGVAKQGNRNRRTVISPTVRLDCPGCRKPLTRYAVPPYVWLRPKLAKGELSPGERSLLEAILVDVLADRPRPQWWWASAYSEGGFTESPAGPNRFRYECPRCKREMVVRGEKIHAAVLDAYAAGATSTVMPA